MAPPAKKKQPPAKKAVSTASAGKKKARASSPDEGTGTTTTAAAAATGTPAAQKTATELGIRDRRLANVVAGALAGGGGSQSLAAEGIAGLSVVERVAGAVDGAAAVAADDDATTTTGKKGKARLLIGGVDVLGRLNARGIAGRVFNDGLSASLGSQSRIFAGPAASAFTDGNARLQRARELKYPGDVPEQAGGEVVEIAEAAAPVAATRKYPSKFDNLSSELAAQLGLRGTVVPAALAAPAQRAPLVTFAAACQGSAATVMAGAASDAVAHRARSHFSTCEGGLPLRGAPASLCTVCQGVARYTCTRCLGLHGYFCSAECLTTHRAARCLKHVV